MIKVFKIGAIVGIASIAFMWFTSGQLNKPGKKQPSSSQPAADQPVPPVAIVYSDQYSINLGGLEKLHPFDIGKYKKIVEQLQKDGALKKADIFEPVQIIDQDILRVQSQVFLDSLKNKKTVIRYLEADALKLVPLKKLDSGVLQPFRYSAGGTLLAADLAMKNQSVAINIGGGFHHAKPNKGEGFCVYADVPISIRKLQAENKIRRALIIDVDAHQGNGTIKCLENDNSTFCFSMHQRDIYPIPKERGDLDINLRAGSDDAAILKILEAQLPRITELSNPDIIYVVGGCDPLYGDPLAGLKMTPEGIIKRDEMIIAFAVQKKIPIVFTLSGGYSKNAWVTQYRSVKNLLEKFGK